MGQKRRDCQSELIKTPQEGSLQQIRKSAHGAQCFTVGTEHPQCNIVCVHHTFLNRGNCHEEETVCESKQFSIRASVALSMAGRSFCQTAMTFWEVFFLNVSTLQSPRPQHISVCSALFCNFLDQSDKMSNTGTCRASVWEKPTSRRWKESDLTTSAFLFHSWSSVEGFNPDVVLYGFVMTSEFMGF